MNNTPTPRTDFAIKASNGRWSFVLKLCSERLERELTAAREEIVKLTKGWADCVLRLSKAEEQRHEYKAALQSADNHNHEIATKLEIVTEQRDRLADLVRQFIYILDITEESDSGRLFHPTNITSCRAGDLQKAGELVEALRRASRNQTTP